MKIFLRKTQIILQKEKKSWKTKDLDKNIDF